MDTVSVNATADKEQLEGAIERPIIFLCHSLGGIIVKRVRLYISQRFGAPHETIGFKQPISSSLYALTLELSLIASDPQALAYSASRTAPKIAHLHSIYTCTFAILFFGTPHSGSSKARLLGSLQKLASLAVPKKALQTESSLLSALEEESETLQNITDQFAPLMPNFRIFFFWEQEKTDLKYTKDYIVDEASAAPILDSTERSGIAADHRGICRFEKSSSQGFRTVVAALQRYSREAPEVVKARTIRAAATLSTQRWYEATELVKGVQGSSTNGGQPESARGIQGWTGGGPALLQHSGVNAE